MGVPRYLRDALRDVVGPAVRAHGYCGTSPTWRKTSDLGDVSVITVQSSAWNSADSGSCVVNLGVAPRPWLDRELLAGDSAPGRRDRPGASECLWWCRVHPQTSIDPHREQWWCYHDEPSAQQVAEAIVTALESTWFATLDALLVPDEFRRRLLAGDPGFEMWGDDPSELDGLLRRMGR
ncbi:DUF4304 domain-containing protein [Curtobacterium sp. 'Ferrero']|uniref:DUF4304 domain-containing protein n=1 Tax=Curtobacterium sp. 'Ferrero' TaxID=2033654 RepID=UPI0011451031|nr:DUF4304 domain-containing protein [Curtobacterium sp. 'Ferrero']